jgi:hypothetical protein
MPPTDEADLYIGDAKVGAVRRKGADASWSFGEFLPNDDFARFAPLFGSWSLLMHEDEQSPLGRAASEELRRVESALDGLRAQLRWHSSGQTLPISQLNIDGPLIEWRSDGKMAAGKKV